MRRPVGERLGPHRPARDERAGAVDRYRQQGLVAARPAIASTGPPFPALTSADLTWQYQDAEDATQYRYILRLTPQGAPAIQVVTARPD